ncbi:MAG: hypothetical protein M3Q97_11700, partial [Bacteroidota bacterium]|nr:hypothetical protein [Bacteroidota bacterium]
MTRQILLFIHFIVFIPLIVHAQRARVIAQGEVDNFTILAEDPYAHNLIIRGGLQLDGYKPNPTIGLYLSGRLYIRNTSSLFFSKSFTLLDSRRRGASGNTNADYSGLRPGTGYDVIFSYHLFDNDDSLKNVLLRLKTGGAANKTVYSRQAATPFRNLQALRLGINRHRSVANGMALITDVPARYFSNLKTTGFTLGIGRTLMHRLEVDAKNYGVITSARILTVYADAILS